MRFWLWWGILLAGVAPVSAQGQPSDYFDYQPGDWPLILEVPHDGTLDVPGVPEKTEKEGSRDTNASKVARYAADRIQQVTGHRPTLLILTVKRDFLDLNRAAGPRAFEHPFLGRVFEAYFDRLTEASQTIQTSFGRGLLVDLHCSGTLACDVMTGTHGGKTMRSFQKTWPGQDFQGAFSLQAVMAERGYRIPGYNGLAFNPGLAGEVVRAAAESGLDAMEFELQRVKFLHNDAKTRQLANDLADGLISFLNHYYLPPPPR